MRILTTVKSPDMTVITVQEALEFVRYIFKKKVVNAIKHEVYKEAVRYLGVKVMRTLWR